MTAEQDNGKANRPKYTPRKNIDLPSHSDDADELGRTYAKHLTGAPFAALRVIAGAEYGKGGYWHDLDLPGLLATLREQGEAVNAGNLAQAEAMLMNQATALQSLFSRLAARAMRWDELAPFEAYMRMALRAQSQCRATLETLAAIKNPSSVAFVRQANIAHGPQQVNNGTPAPTSRAGDSENPPNEQSGEANELLPDSRASQAASRVDTALEAVGEIDRAEVGDG